MKIKIDDLERAVKWMKSHSQDVMCNITEIEKGLQITCKDKYAKYVDMKLTQEGNIGPKIIKEDELP